MPPDTFACYLVSKDDAGHVHTRVAEKRIDELPAGDVLVRVAYSSLNYKDALSATGHAGVTRKYPHIPGIDAAGTVASSSAPAFREGDQVLVTGYDLGQNTWGGFSEYVRVPVGWVVPLPRSLSLRESMIYGTAGFTAAQCVDALLHRGTTPARGEVVVTGATGGVGSLAVALLAKAGFQVAASTGKSTAAEYLTMLGATKVIPRSDVHDTSDKPLLPTRWAGAVDTVGGTTLATLVRSVQRAGCVTACGLVGGVQLPLTVYPFLLRGVDLVGIDSAECPLEKRIELWQRLATDWKPPCLDKIATAEVDLAHVGQQVEEILAGRITGRVLVKPTS
jgi:putative YhdH/YhfP family quinone oxidoreductase